MQCTFRSGASLGVSLQKLVGVRLSGPSSPGPHPPPSFLLSRCQLWFAFFCL